MSGLLDTITSTQPSLNRHTRAVAFLIVSAVVLITFTGIRAWHKRFWYDEIFTIAIADQRSGADMWKAYWSGFEFNPPLIYYVTRATRHLGSRELFARVPEIAAYAVMVICLCSFVARRLPAVFALPVVTFAVVSEAYDYSFEARPYALVFAFAALALLGWQTAAEPGVPTQRRRVGLVLLLIGLSGALLSHCYAVLLCIPFISGELWRTWRTKRVDVPLWIIAAVSAAPVIAYPSLLSMIGKTVVGGYLAANARRLLGAYAIVLVRALPPLCILIGPIAVMAAHQRRDVRKAARKFLRRVPGHEIVAVLGFTLIPACGWLAARAMHSQYITRYGLSAVLGLCILLSYAIFILGLQNRKWPVWVFTGSMIWFVCSFALDARHWPTTRSGDNNEQYIMSLASSGTPVVVSEGRTFLALAYYLPPGGAREITYLTDPADAVRLTGTNMVDIALRQAYPWLPIAGRVEAYRSFIARTRRFWLYTRSDHPLEWVREQLRDDGAQIHPTDRPFFYDVQMHLYPRQLTNEP